MTSMISVICRDFDVNSDGGASNNCWLTTSWQVNAFNGRYSKETIDGSRGMHLARFLVLLYNERPQRDVDLLECSHRCSTTKCIRPSHMILEEAEINNERKKCTYGSKSTCSHSPSCIFVDSNGKTCPCRNENRRINCRSGCELSCFHRFVRIPPRPLTFDALMRHQKVVERPFEDFDELAQKMVDFPALHLRHNNPEVVDRLLNGFREFWQFSRSAIDPSIIELSVELDWTIEDWESDVWSLLRNLWLQITTTGTEVFQYVKQLLTYGIFCFNQTLIYPEFLNDIENRQACRSKTEYTI